MNYTIAHYHPDHRIDLLKVWERSVLATHAFLTPEDFAEIKKFLYDFDFQQLQVFCLTEHDKVIGFLGLAELKIEMLFLDPAYIGKGLGYKLMDYAVNTLKANAVDVNEQNTKATDFYEKYGFEVYERTAKDDQGRDYPLLRMKLRS